jgi:WD40 repeat protein
MDKSIVFKNILFCLLAGLVQHSKINATSLNGTSGIVYQNQHYVFRDGDIAQGFVRLNGGFTILPNARVTMDLVSSVSRGINLRETGELQLVNDLVFDGGVTFSTGGYLNGRGHALDFRGTFTMPHAQVLHIVSDTIIDGQGGTLLFSPNSHLFVEHNATLTLRNMAINATRNNPLVPVLRCGGNSARIALDNVSVGLANDFVFDKGRLFIHNDVVMTGTHTFIYKSAMPLLVDSSGILTFDLGTGFSFASTSTDQRLFVLKDATSSLCFNGAAFNATSTGVRFTKGTIFLDNKIVINSKTDVEVSGATLVTSTRYGDGIESQAWSPDGKYLVVAGNWPDPVGSDFAKAEQVVLYSFTGSTLVTVTSQSYSNTFFGHVRGVEWSPDGQFVAVGGEDPVPGLGGFNNTNVLRIYRFTGSQLNPVTSAAFTSQTSDLTRARWRPDQRYIALSGETAPGMDLLIYRFNGSSLTLTTSRKYSSTIGINDAAWSPDGRFLAIGGQGPISNGASGFANTNELRIYSFNGSTLTPVTSQAYGGGAGTVYNLAWSPDGKFLLIGGSGATSGSGGFANTHNVRLYAFNGTSLMPRASFDGKSPVAWHPSGLFAAVQDNAGTSIELLRFDGTSLTSIASFSGSANIESEALWDPSGKFFSSGIQDATVYGTNFASPLSQQFSKAIIFGDSVAGSASNCNVEVLGGAHVTINGVVSDDSA